MKESDEEVKELEKTFNDAGKFKAIKSPLERKIFKDKQGNKLTSKEFFARWKQGIEGITPAQQVKVQITSTRIMLFGIVAGLIVTFFTFKTLWWVSLILTGALGTTYVQYVGLLQKKRAMENFENLDEGVLDDVFSSNNVEGGKKE